MAELTKSKDMTPYDFREMEKRDEAQILAELQGEIVDEMIYQFPSGGRIVTGISWMGIKEIARRYGKIDVNLVHFEDLGNAYMIVVKAIDIEKGTGLLGTSTQSKMMSRKDGSETPDDFCVQKAMSKAQRNAIRSIIPETYFKTVFAELAKDHPPTRAGRKEVESEKTEVYPLPKMPLDTPTWDFAEKVESKGWEEVDAVIVAYLFDMGFENPESAFEYGHDVVKCWIKNAPGVFFGDGFKEIDTVLQIAGFKYNRPLKGWRFNKPEKPAEEEEPVEEPAEEPAAEEPKEEPTPKGEELESDKRVSRDGPILPAQASPGSEEAPQGPPRSVDEVTERIASVMPGHSELVKISEYKNYYRIGRVKMLDTEIEEHLTVLVSEMGGEWNREKTAWIIPKEEG